jgi:hypothetical protein
MLTLFFAASIGIPFWQPQAKIKLSNYGSLTKQAGLDLSQTIEVTLMMFVELDGCQKVIYSFQWEKIKPLKFGQLFKLVQMLFK